jgi:hypothetical protein
LKPFRLKAIVLIPKAVNQIPTTGQAAKKKCKEREIVETSILENQSAKITVSSYNVVSWVDNNVE